MDTQTFVEKAKTRVAMPVEAFGYLGLHSDRLDDWADFGPRFLGLQITERTRTMLKFRMDDRKQRFVISSDADMADTFGFEVSTAEALDAIAARVEAVQIPVTRLNQAERAVRAVADAIRFIDPAGNRVEVFRGQESADTPFVPARPISGFRTGPFGMGHTVLYVERAEDVLWFYFDVLGFRLSDFTLRPFKAFFFHVNGRHHSLAIVQGSGRRIHHVMLELNNLDDVGQGYDLMLQEPERIGTTLGRHTNDFILSYYAHTPSGFLLEYGWGGRTVDPSNFVPTRMDFGPSLWGHERSWLPPEMLLDARKVRAEAQQAGLRAPVQVMAENSETGFTRCPWWETQKQRG